MINQELLEEFKEFCKLNDLDVEETVNKAIKSGFTILKYGATPISAKNEQKTVEVVKTVEKIVKVSDNTKVNELLSTIGDLTGEIVDLKDEIGQYKVGLAEAKQNIKDLEKNRGKDIYGE